MTESFLTAQPAGRLPQSKLIVVQYPYQMGTSSYTYDVFGQNCYLIMDNLVETSAQILELAPFEEYCFYFFTHIFGIL